MTKTESKSTVLGPAETGVRGTVVAAATPEAAQAMADTMKDEFAQDRKKDTKAPEAKGKP